MNNYTFPTFPSSASVASGVTVLTSVWFLVAGAAILSDPSSPYTTRKEFVASEPVKTAHVEVNLRRVAVAPQALGTIYVSARRSAT
ncbi:MAG TPA: hypothetical protein VKR38_10660 [Usitatibacter sp.]|nr:hypothetical protein [Usitatibacter sp.]